ncbi:MAG: nucleotidyltransferase family protein [Pseudomonadota bacterium]
MSPSTLVLRAFREPDSLVSLGLAEWDLLLRQVRHANLLARLYTVLEERSLLQQVPSQPLEHLNWAYVVLDKHAQAVRWEVMQIRKALADVDIPIILLKGAAYALAKLPHARGRIFSDIDILVPKNRLNEVEAALMLNGWAVMDLDAYDQHYYRTWMHELPPMQHHKRMTVIDVHHAIMPQTAHVRPDSEKLCAAASELPEYPGLKVLNPTDMVLHSAAHLLHDSELDHGLRDLVDIDSLLRQFCSLPNFWPNLVERAKEIELTRTLFYALRYAVYVLGTPVPAEAINAARIGRPSRFTLFIMDPLFHRALMPDHPSCSDWLTGIARWLLYIRANWLRMPPLLLARHLFHKAFISPRHK